MRMSKIQKKIKLEFMVCSSVCPSWLLQHLFIISFSSRINSDLILGYCPCNYQIFPYVSKIDFVNIFFPIKLSIYHLPISFKYFVSKSCSRYQLIIIEFPVKVITEYLKEIYSKSSKNCKDNLYRTSE